MLSGPRLGGGSRNTSHNRTAAPLVDSWPDNKQPAHLIPQCGDRRTGWFERNVMRILVESERLLRRHIQVAGDGQIVVALEICDRLACCRAGDSVDDSVVVAIVGKLLLGTCHQRASALVASRHRPEAAIDHQPAAVVPAVLMAIPIIHLALVPTRMIVSGSPATPVTIGTGVLSGCRGCRRLGLIRGIACASTACAACLRDLSARRLGCRWLTGGASAD